MDLPSNVDEEETLKKPPKFPDNPYDYFDSNCSTPYVSAPSSPSRNLPTTASYFFSAPTSPIHFLATSTAASFEFNGPESTESMIAADEIFLNGQIRPMKLSSHLKNPQLLSPLSDLNEEDEEEEEITAEVYNRGRDFRSGSVHRRARSLSPLRNSRFQWQDEEEEEEEKRVEIQKIDKQNNGDNTAVESVNSSASNSRSSSSSSRHSKRWIFLKDLLYRSKSEGREREKSADKEKFWHSISFSSATKDKSKEPKSNSRNSTNNGNKKAVDSNGVRKRRGPIPSAHERHYTANRAQAEEMRKRTFLPYRQGLIGCLGFNSKSYGAVSGFAKAINPVSSR